MTVNVDRYLAAERALFAHAGIDPMQHWLDLPTGPRARIIEHGTGTPVLFLHGGPNAAATWAYVAAATSGVRCLLLDRPGCGLSDPPSTVPNNRTVAGYVTDLTLNVLDRLGLDRVVIVGSSFGGYSALSSALAHPDRITGIVLAGCPAFVPGWTAPSFFSLLRTPILGRLPLAAPTSAASVRMSLRQMGHASSLGHNRISPAMLDWMRAWGRDTPTMRNDAAMIIACGTWRGGFDPALDLTTDELARINLPVDLLFGANDPVGGRIIGDRLAGALPNATIDCLPDAGHLPWLDDPDWLAAGIRATIQRSARR